MSCIKIVESKSYLPETKILNDEIEENFNLEKGFIEQRTGIKTRYYATNEEIEEMAFKAVNKMKKESLEDIDLIIVATTSSSKMMPSIANYVQKKLGIKQCISLDILAGCSGFINAFDIARLYIIGGIVNKALVIGVDKLSTVMSKNDMGTIAVLSDGAGAVVIEKTDKAKKYYSNIKAEIDQNNMLTYQVGATINMQGKEVYKYAITNPVQNVNELIEKSEESKEKIKFIIPHQSNLKIMNSIAKRLQVPKEKIFKNIDKNGNTFCASIPIAISEMMENNLLESGDIVILLGYGGGLNTGSILLEI